ncbi:hypothetical protein L198_02678 [Cryptococcus wingfieldii CBS 7118]|uniref:Tetrapyrrole biosynthesis uroporphyrinogen III synthase domain-containing protein n=1 Tax=Cryptococcus wingfieldii CBS 7118 TaxID=1295528 RepID=A0A1E3JP87_9TREE|nr:hypothetical protein L198_02678 [Cryptococcus wingfieldii CBS 7118]ODO01947.1 hypothetical protein L198_02678 [Cryptococcus wingfieldii CBS 7118]
MSGRTPNPVILFKTPNSSLADDPYHAALSRPCLSSQYQPHWVPVLQETYSIDELVPFLEDGPIQWEGIIVTSRRGMEGWVRAVQAHLAQQSGHKGKGRAVDSQENWSDIPLFSVGQASTEHLAAADIPPEFKPTCVPEMLGTPPKSAGSLSDLILNTPPRGKWKETKNGNGDRKGHRPYLFLCGDKSLEEMPATLRAAGRTVKDILVYTTSPRLGIAETLSSVSQSSPELGSKGWLGFFSPSSAAIVVPLLKGEESKRWQGWRVFAIGDTTRRSLIEDMGVEVHAVADRPNAEGTLQAILSADEESK